MRFLDRTQALDALREAWEDVAAGTGSVVALTIAGEPGLFVRVADTPPPAPVANPHHLTTRQQDVLDLVCAGLTNAEIADYLVVSVRTVDHHVSAILRKLGVANRRAARALILDTHPIPLRPSGNPTRPRVPATHHNSRPLRVLRNTEELSRRIAALTERNGAA
ncbi:response regulator transcription factor [Nocardia huaxiensis]|uniref:HTH luxR-type domain-containing protein n=1 Tax=Nocardia huaxiensis TaxID=2755382 RepID=A0A7D6ZJG9_9NOCA|nr:LuxR C-terminal-related transcriptional regulator [Nocardia huaxiensis]QLY31200.1 hypothetical protein H0264_02085 [Nocardia huaxiensis]UFS94730.1 LuxR C-terminal-related transcriptional regulator [Nocardia huaxiensis]